VPGSCSLNEPIAASIASASGVRQVGEAHGRVLAGHWPLAGGLPGRVIGHRRLGAPVRDFLAEQGPDQ
jgi:hypothetical protein